MIKSITQSSKRWEIVENRGRLRSEETCQIKEKYSWRILFFVFLFSNFVSLSTLIFHSGFWHFFLLHVFLDVITFWSNKSFPSHHNYVYLFFTFQWFIKPFKFFQSILLLMEMFSDFISFDFRISFLFYNENILYCFLCVFCQIQNNYFQLTIFFHMPCPSGLWWSWLFATSCPL